MPTWTRRGHVTVKTQIDTVVRKLLQMIWYRNIVSTVASSRLHACWCRVSEEHRVLFECGKRHRAELQLSIVVAFPSYYCCWRAMQVRAQHCNDIVHVNFINDITKAMVYNWSIVTVFIDDYIIYFLGDNSWIFWIQVKSSQVVFNIRWQTHMITIRRQYKLM